jgi:hypothetical protein
MESNPPVEHNHQTEVADLDLLARMICDRIGDRFTWELERQGFHRGPNIQTEILALLTQDIVHLLSQRLRIEQERQGHFSGRLPW